MNIQKTLAIIKPDAVAAGHIGVIINEIEKNGFQIVAMKMRHLTAHQAEGFYAVHSERPFFKDLVNFMTEGPVVTMILQRENAIEQWRNLMGVTNPAEAAEGTIRNVYGTNIERNAVHGSDGNDTADFETQYFFKSMEIL